MSVRNLNEFFFFRRPTNPALLDNTYIYVVPIAPQIIVKFDNEI